MTLPPLLPTDACTQCATTTRGAPVHPVEVQLRLDQSGLIAWYVCPWCGHRWHACWALDAIDIPCPGCVLCDTVAGEAA